MSKPECIILGSPRSPPVKVLEEWPGSINLQPDHGQHHCHASHSQSVSRAAGPSLSSGFPAVRQMPEGMDTIALDSASLAKASRGSSFKDRDMPQAGSFQDQEQSNLGSETMRSGHEADPSEERFMTPPERRSRRSSPEEDGEESGKQGQGIHPPSSGAQQQAVSRALVFQSLDSPVEDDTVSMGARADVEGRQHALAIDEDDDMAPADDDDDDDDVAILEERPVSRAGDGSGRQRRGGRGAAVGVASEDGEDDARGGEGDPQSQEDADLALAKAMQEQECAFMLLHQQQHYQYSPSPGLSLPGDSSSSQRLASRESGASSRGHRSNSGGFSQAMDRLSVLPQGATGASGSSQLIHQRPEQGQRREEGEGAQGSGSARELQEGSPFEESLQAFGDAPGAPGEEAGGAGSEGVGMSDEEFARRLQEEEERQMAARLMAMAGVGARPLIRPRVGAPVPAMGVPAAARDWVLQGRQGGRAGGEGEGVGSLEDEDEEDEEFDDEEGEEYGYYEDGDYEGDALDVDNMSYEELTALGEAIGTEAKGLAPQVIASLPRATFLASDHHKSGETGAGGDDEICAICRCEFEDGDSLSLLMPCKHSYHVDCIAEWLKLNKVCPICKAEVHLESASKAPRPKDRMR